MGSARGHSVFSHLLNLLESHSAALTIPGSIGFDIGSGFFRCPPSETRDYLNPPLISGWLDCESELTFRVSPGTGSSSFSEWVERSRCCQCPYEGSACRPDMGILQHSWAPALLIQELARKFRLARNLQSWCIRATTQFAQVQSAVRPQPKSR